MKLYILTHLRFDSEDDQDSKFIGVFSSPEIARSTIEQLADLPGYRKYPDGFSIEEYAVNEIRWTEGFND
jgi:homoserine kinase type II